MEKPEDFTKQRESKIANYSEMVGKEKPSKDTWGYAEYKGDIIPCYTDEGFAGDVFTSRIIENFSERGLTLGETVKVVDFGGGDGGLTSIVSKQLTEAGYKVVAVNLEINDGRFPAMTERFNPINETDPDRKLYGVQGSLTRDLKETKVVSGETGEPTGELVPGFNGVPIKNESIDAGYSRFVLQYIPKEKQAEAIKEMLATIKPGGELVIMWPIVSETEDQAKVMDELDVNMDSIVLGKNPDEIRGKRHLTSIEEMKKIAEDLGVSCDVGFVDDFRMSYTADNFAGKFNEPDPLKLEKLRVMFTDPSFKEMAQSAGYEVTEENGKTYWAFKVAVAVLKP